VSLSYCKAVENRRRIVRFEVVRVKNIGEIPCSGMWSCAAYWIRADISEVLQSPSPGMMMEAGVPLKHTQQCS